LFGFHLRRELGRGAFACVYLAEQADLAGRPVVLKVSAIAGREPQTLAQLQHTHIVPIHSVHEDPKTGLRAVCMPYFGGASLSRVLQALWSRGSRPAHGEQLVRALEEARQAPVAAGGPPAAAPATGGPPVATKEGKPGGPTTLALLGGMSYARAVVWIVARLAEALEHAHQRGVLHRDIKPSNVLLSADGQPMLLDFNLAQDVRNGQAQATAVLGGTVAFMAPEHLRALAARDPGLGRQVDQRADIYSLGMVLYEMLAGCNPFDQSGSYSPLVPLVQAMALERGRTAPSLRQKRPDLPWGLESIVRKCMAPQPAQRYQRAEQLAEDLRRFLDDRPLKYAPELSTTERVRKWLRRHPRLTSSGSVAAAAVVLLAASGAALAGVRQHLLNARAQLAAVQAEERKRAYEAGTVRALCLVNTTTEVQDHLRQGLAVCEETLGLYGVLDRDDWQEHPDWQRLGADERRRLAEDTRELLLLLAWARVRTAPEDREAARRALALLDRAEGIDGLPPSRALWEDRAVDLDRQGDTAGARAARARAERIDPVTFRDHYQLATSYARNNRYADAVAELNQALALNPQHYWSWVQRGICYQELGKFTLATGDFGACIGLWPDFAWGYFNRGYVLERSGHKAEAIADYTAALRRDPDFLLATVNRAMVYLEVKQYERALVDFEQAARQGRDDASLHAGRGPGGARPDRGGGRGLPGGLRPCRVGAGGGPHAPALGLRVRRGGPAAAAGGGGVRRGAARAPGAPAGALRPGDAAGRAGAGGRGRDAVQPGRRGRPGRRRGAAGAGHLAGAARRLRWRQPGHQLVPGAGRRRGRHALCGGLCRGPGGGEGGRRLRIPAGRGPGRDLPAQGLCRRLRPGPGRPRPGPRGPAEGPGVPAAAATLGAARPGSVSPVSVAVGEPPGLSRRCGRRG
jgi:serine/threonine protein kinase